MNFSEEDKKRIFRQARKVKGLDENKWRLDAADALIFFDSYGREDEIFGWEIDHIYPQAKLEELNVPQNLIHDDRNLRAMNWNNNLSKSNDYPEYKSTIRSLDDGKSNSIGEWTRTINQRKQEQLKKLFNGYNI